MRGGLKRLRPAGKIKIRMCVLRVCDIIKAGKEVSTRPRPCLLHLARIFYFIFFFQLQTIPLVRVLIGTFSIFPSWEKRDKRICRFYTTLNGGSLGSWIDEERSKVR